MYISVDVQRTLPKYELKMRHTEDAEEKRKAYDKLRRCIGTFIARIIRLEYVEKQYDNMTAQEREKTNREIDRENESWERWRDASDKIQKLIEKDPDFYAHINTYGFDDYEMELAQHYSVPLPDGWIRKKMRNKY